MKVLPCMICLKKNSFSFHEVIDPISVFIITLPCEKVVLNFNKRKGASYFNKSSNASCNTGGGKLFC